VAPCTPPTLEVSRPLVRSGEVLVLDVRAGGWLEIFRGWQRSASKVHSDGFNTAQYFAL
jgi:hypothetical protein